MPDSTTLEEVTAQIALRLRNQPEATAAAEGYILSMQIRGSYRYIYVSSLTTPPTPEILSRIGHVLLLPYHSLWTHSRTPMHGGDKALYTACHATKTYIEWAIDEQKVAVAPIEAADPPPGPGDTQEVDVVRAPYYPQGVEQSTGARFPSVGV